MKLESNLPAKWSYQVILIHYLKHLSSGSRSRSRTILPKQFHFLDLTSIDVLIYIGKMSFIHFYLFLDLCILF